MPEIHQKQEIFTQGGTTQMHTDTGHHEPKGVLEKVYEKVTGKDKDEDYQLRKDAEKLEKKAEKLGKEGHKEISNNDKDVKRAEKLQAEAAAKAHEANKATEHALNKQVEGQDKLATAGHKMMEAGAKIQAQANNSHTCQQVPYNQHAQHEVRQHTSTTGTTVPVVGQQSEHITREYHQSSH